MEATSGRYQLTIDAISEWAQRFGLLDEETGQYATQLDMCIEPNDEGQWKDKDLITKMVNEKVQQVIDYRQK